MSTIELKINNYITSSWNQANVYSTMDAVSGIAELMTFNYFNGNLGGWKIKIGDVCQLLLSGEVVITGYVDHVEMIYESRKHMAKFILRDKTCDMNDCNWNEDVTEWKNQTVLNLTSNLCAPFNIDITTDSEVAGDIGKIIETFKINQGEFIIDAIMRYCNQFDLVPISYGDGKLTLSKSTGTKMSHDAIDLNGNVVSRKAVYSNFERYSDYIVKGIGCGTDQKNNYTDYIQPVGSVHDDIVTRYRPIVYFDDVVTDSGKCVERAKWMKQVQAGKSRGIKYTVAGWEQTNGELWKINHITRVYDPVIQIDSNMLISSVRFLYGREAGPRTELVVVNKNTYTKVQKDIKTGFDE